MLSDIQVKEKKKALWIIYFPSSAALVQLKAEQRFSDMHSSFFTPAAVSLLLIHKVPNEKGAESTLQICFLYMLLGGN